MKKVEMLFYPVNPSDTNIGLKFVLFEVTDAASVITYDWGFAMWNGLSWEPLEVPAGYECKVKWWSNTLHPDVLVKEKSKILKLGE